MRNAVFVAVVLALAAPAAAVPPSRPAAVPRMDRSVEPVVLTGAQFPTWSAGPDPTAREPEGPGNIQTQSLGGDLLGTSDCHGQVEEDGSTDHSCYQQSRIPRNPLQGAAVNRILGYRWTRQGFVQIPFQVDEKYSNYISNNQSGFAFYSGTDEHDTYVFDREGWRYTYDEAWLNAHAQPAVAGGDPCLAEPKPGSPVNAEGNAAAADPIKGLDDNDEMVFMERDAGPAAPAGVSLPDGIQSAYKVAVVDPLDPTHPRFVYVALAADGGPAPAYTAENSPYVRYQRDANADRFVYSQSSYDSYGNAPKGPFCNADGTTGFTYDANGNKVYSDPADSKTWRQRRPLDTAWVRTPRYSFRYDGRWLMTELHVNNAPRGNRGPDPATWTYGPDLVDRWKARAFQQDPSSDTPCCGYEEEATNWGGSSIMMGERWGPVRVIREAWGADSSTNNARREVFYSDSIDFGDALRVHPIPPLDGIYVQWDHNAGTVDEYYNPSLPNGIPIDGSNSHEVYGNFDDPCNANYDSHPHSDVDATYRSVYAQAGLCPLPNGYHQSIDVVDLTQNNPEGTLQWEQVTGASGTLVSRWALRDVTPGGAAQGVVAVPYYRDDSCFDDGTGTSPGPRLRLRGDPEPDYYVDATGSHPRTCWRKGDPIDPNFTNLADYWGAGNHDANKLNDVAGADERYYQGSIGTHGLHLMFIADSDNADQTVPLDEIDSVQHMVIRPGCDVDANGAACNVGERYGRTTEYPLQTIVAPMDAQIAVTP